MPQDEKAIKTLLEETDFLLIKEMFLIESNKNFWLKLLYNWHPSYRKLKQNGLKSIDFLEKIKQMIQNKPQKDQAYLLLGAYQYTKRHFGELPISGTLGLLALRRDDLLQTLSENTEDISIEKIFENPNVVLEKSEAQFNHFLATEQNISKII